MKTAGTIQDSVSPGSIDQAITGLAVILVAGTLILPFAKGAIVGTGSSNTVGNHVPGDGFTVLDTTNLSLPTANWLVPEQATYILSGLDSGQFIDPGAGTNPPLQVYRLRWP